MGVGQLWNRFLLRMFWRPSVRITIVLSFHANITTWYGKVDSRWKERKGFVTRSKRVVLLSNFCWMSYVYLKLPQQPLRGVRRPITLSLSLDIYNQLL